MIKRGHNDDVIARLSYLRARFIHSFMLVPSHPEAPNDSLSYLGIQSRSAAGRAPPHREHSGVCPDFSVKPGDVFCACWSVREGDSSEMIHSCRARALTGFLPVPLSV